MQGRALLSPSTTSRDHEVQALQGKRLEHGQTNTM